MKKGISGKTALSIVLVTMVFSMLMTTAIPAHAATQEDIDLAIETGMAWLAGKQDAASGSWAWSVAKTGFAVVKFETHAINIGEDPLDPAYQYYTQVRNGLDYIFLHAWTANIGIQPAGDPDTLDNGIGVAFGAYSIYETGIAMMAIGESTHPEMVVNVAGSAVNGRTYQSVVQDAVDYLAWGQTDRGNCRGGWDYGANDNSPEWGRSDNSNSGYAVLGLAYAEAFGCTIPAFVRTELSIWIDWIQNDVDGDPNDGGSGYDNRGDAFWVNTLKTGNLLFEMAFFGDDTTVQRVKDAADYLDRHWNDPDYIGWKGPGPEPYPWEDPKGYPDWPACYQAMYCIMKGFEILNIEYISPLNDPSGIDWFEDFADVLVDQQDNDGSWPNATLFGAPDGRVWSWDDDHILSTEWALLTLQKVAPPPPVITVYVDIKPGSWPNPVNLASRGVLPVAICGTEDFDVTTIDVTTIKLTLEGLDDGVSPIRWSYEDVATPWTGEPGGGHALGGDGYLDLTLKFKTQEVRTTLGLDAFLKQKIPLIITGNLNEAAGGTHFTGQDYVWILNLPGDSNDDMIVNIIDVSVVSAHWYPGPPVGPLGYDAASDLNGDSNVDILDIALISSQWAQFWQP